MGGLIIMAVVMAGGLVVGVLALIYIAPVFNKWLSYVWEDPSEKQRLELVKRIKELHVDGNVPAETSVLMASKEMGADEAATLKMLGKLSPSDIKAVLTGRKTLPGVFVGKFLSGLYKGMGGKR